MNWLIKLLGGYTKDEMDIHMNSYNVLLNKYRKVELDYLKQIKKLKEKKLGNVRLKENVEVKRGRGRPKKQ